MDFTYLEKLAVLKAIDEVMMADNQVDIGEAVYLTQILEIFKLEINILTEARKMKSSIATNILQDMNAEKKAMLYVMMREMADADGETDMKELEVILSILQISGTIN